MKLPADARPIDPPKAKFPAVGTIRRVSGTTALLCKDASGRCFVSADGQWYEIGKREG